MTNILLSSTDIAECITNLIARNKLWARKKLKLFFIVNSKAGCFTNKKISKQYYNLFTETNREALESQPCASSTNYEIFETQYQRHGEEIIGHILENIFQSNNKSSTYVIVTAGGDGTSLEVQTALYNEFLKGNIEHNKVLDKILVLRLPLGTGNDGTDCTFIGETFELLKSSIIYSNAKVLVTNTENDPPEESIKQASPFFSKYCDIKSKAPWLTFNIASIGIDSFICFITNLIKSKFPGNIYHILIPLCGLFYDRVFKTGTAKIEMFDNLEDETPSNTFNGKIFLTVMGTSGYRTYGGGHKVLPNFNNVCIASKIPLWRVIRDNGKFASGKHVGMDIGRMFTAEKMIINYDQPLMLQCDGECYLLCKDHFPLTVEKRNAGFKVLRRTM